MDSVLLADMRERIQTEEYAINSITVIRNGHIPGTLQDGYGYQ
jgi:hypothetical protein